ncbi:1-acyl-sn-glycerol-3-phosphate acyltransferase [Candidatus Woesearchaeota archaeon]|nr:1-acyl-sn-glycerol-3-phosphate acyltransferase [Candidatus Woesearchaeota archaeon]
MAYLIPKLTIIPAVKLYFKKISGIENLPKKGAFIAAANHASYMDHLIIAGSLVSHLNRKVHFLAKKEHFDNIFKKAWHTYAGAIPLDRQSGGKEALGWAIKALKEGKIIAIHPEGTRSLTGKLQKAKTGVARLALLSKAPVVPIGLIGTFEILPKGKYIPKFKRGAMSIGKPMYFNDYYNKKINKKILREVTTRIMKEIAKLCKQKYNFR